MSARWDAAKSRAQRVAITYYGEDVIFTPASSPGLAKTVRMVFDNAYVSQAPDASLSITSTGPIFSVILSDLPTKPVQDDTITRQDGTVYTISEPQPDGLGLADLICHRTSPDGPGPILGGGWLS